MRLDFNVLWVDDQPSAVESQIVAIKTRMAGEGFNFNPQQCATIEEVEGLIAGDVFQDEVDLILVDWDLGAGAKGQDVIERIRQVLRYKDVIFYSSLTPATELRQLAYKQNLEGVYCASKGELKDEVMGVFNALVKKVLDLDHTRGIVMGATSDIDHIVKICLTKAYAILDEAGKREFIAEGLHRIAQKIRENTEESEELNNNPSVDALFNAHRLFTADDRIRMLAKMMIRNEFESHSGAKKTIGSYRNEVVPLRNKLGHLVLTPEGKPKAVETTEGTQISLDEMRDLRKLILNLREEFRTLVDRL